MTEFKYCRICLDTNVRMHQIIGSEVQGVYEKITNNKVQYNEYLYYACYMCYCQLKKCHQLATKSKKSDEILKQILAKDGQLDLKSIITINKHAYCLLNSMIVATLDSIEIQQFNKNIKTENRAESDDNNILVKCEPSNNNDSELYLGHTVSGGHASESLNDYGFSIENSSASEDDMPLKCISTYQTPDKRVDVNKIVSKKQKKKAYNETVHFHTSSITQQIFISELNPKENSITNGKYKHKPSNVKTNKRKCIKENMKRKTVRRQDLPKVTTGKSLKTTQTKQTDGHKHQRENTIKLLLNSNGCLFTSYRTKFGCDLCPERFLDIKHVREHIKIHSDDKYIVSSVNYLRGRSYKNVDISNLRCKMCEQPCQDLTELQTHLTVSHSIQFYGTENFLTPYKLENGLQCIRCQQKFNTFLRLSIHMNSHSTNNVCEICGMSYINRSSLRLHVQAVHKEKKCTLCPSTFLNNSTKMRHMRSVHRLGGYKRYCQLCEKTFRYTYLLVEHRIKEHGAKRTISECVDCGKNFSSLCNLKTHIRSVHIKERNFPCPVCDMRFFTKCDLKRHERTHEDVRSFSCAHCEARFKTRDSWRRHLKRQHAQLMAQT